MKVDSAQHRIVVDGELLAAPETPVYIAVYNPRGVLVVSKDDRGRRTVRDLVPVSGPICPVGD